MSALVPVTINEKSLQVPQGKTVLEVCEENGIPVPVMCRFKGLTNVGACRLCLVEIQGIAKLLPACSTKVAPNQVIKTDSEKLKKYRRMIVELLFAERNHFCAVCVANNDCELQDLAHAVGMDHVRFAYLYQNCQVDASHPQFVIDHNRCVMCTRCVRVCGEVEGAFNWDVKNRGYKARIISDFDQPWGESQTCTSCGKCTEVCPTGALWRKDAKQGQFEKEPATVQQLIERRKVAL